MEEKYFYVDCRNIIVRVLTKYLDRIDLFRTQYELTKELKFQLDDISAGEFNKYINWLRDGETIVPKELKTIYNYLNTDCERKNKEEEKEKIFINIKRNILEYNNNNKNLDLNDTISHSRSFDCYFSNEFYNQN